MCKFDSNKLRFLLIFSYHTSTDVTKKKEKPKIILKFILESDKKKIYGRIRIVKLRKKHFKNEIAIRLKQSVKPIQQCFKSSFRKAEVINETQSSIDNEHASNNFKSNILKINNLQARMVLFYYFY